MDRIETVYRARSAGYGAALATVTGDQESARDAVQEGFARAVRGRLSFRGGSLEAWIWKIALRIAIDARQPREVVLDVDAVDVRLVDENRDPELTEAIRTLTPRRRLVVFLRYFADLSYAEIADAMDVSEGTVAATLAQARDVLREQLTSERAER